MGKKEQIILYSLYELEEYIGSFHNAFLVCGDSAMNNCASGVLDVFDRYKISYDRFGDFAPNPTTHHLDMALKQYSQKKYDVLVAIGGGSAIDIAKCIKLYSDVDWSVEWTSRFVSLPKCSDIPLIVMPTTAGSGSEATRFAVLYHNEKKQSITCEQIIPDAVLFEEGVIKSLPLYQRKATMFDAFCHSIESFWSVNSTDESKEFASEAIRIIKQNYNEYLFDSIVDPKVFSAFQRAAYLAGKAINISQTTAGHAMSYKITSMFGCAHGHAVSLVMCGLIPWMIDNTEKCIDNRGSGYLEKTFDELASLFDCPNKEMFSQLFLEMFRRSGLETPTVTENDISILSESVNPERLRNNPIAMDKDDIEKLYHKILIVV